MVNLSQLSASITIDVMPNMNYNSDLTRRIANALRWTSSYDPLCDHELLLQKIRWVEDFAKTGKASWIFTDNKFEKWDSSTMQGLQTLWIHGPGELCMSSCVLAYIY
jgi:hypothetical protein